MLPLLRQFVAGGGELPIWRAALARAEWEAGNPTAARREYEGLAAGGFRDIDGHFASSVTLAHLAELCVYFGDKDRAPWLAERFAPYRGRLIVSPRAGFSLGPADCLLGLLAALIGEYDEARVLLDDALALSQRLGARPGQARCHEALSNFLRADGRAGRHTEEAARHARTASDLRRATGMPPL
jgi:hypothetical protein